MSVPHSVRSQLWADATALVQSRYEAAMASLPQPWAEGYQEARRQVVAEFGFEEFRNNVLGRWHALVSDAYNPMYDAEVKRRRANYEALYHITFTCDPKKGVTLPVFKQRVYDTLERKTFIRVELAFEHEDINFHAHAFCVANHPLNKDNFQSFARRTGFVKVQHVKKDNGVRDYISKEAQVLYCRDIRQDNEWHTIDAPSSPPAAVAGALPSL